jgi:hypothetical protein
MLAPTDPLQGRMVQSHRVQASLLSALRGDMQFGRRVQLNRTKINLEDCLFWPHRGYGLFGCLAGALNLEPNSTADFGDSLV